MGSAAGLNGRYTASTILRDQVTFRRLKNRMHEVSASPWLRSCTCVSGRTYKFLRATLGSRDRLPTLPVNNSPLQLICTMQMVGRLHGRCPAGADSFALAATCRTAHLRAVVVSCTAATQAPCEGYLRNRTPAICYSHQPRTEKYISHRSSHLSKTKQGLHRLGSFILIV